MTEVNSNLAPEAPAGTIGGDRHVSEVAGRGPKLDRKFGVGAIVVFAVLGVGGILLTSQRPNLQTNAGPPVQARPIVQYEAPPALPVTAQAAVVPPLPDGQVGAPPLPVQQVSAAPAPTRSAASQGPARLLVYNTSGSGGASMGGGAQPGMMPVGYGDGQAGAGYPGGAPGAGGGTGAGGQQGSDGLAARLTPTRLSGVSANVLQNQPYLLTTGTLMPCVLQTAMDSTLPGFVTCVIPQDILGKTGLTLLDRGTKVVGQFQGGVRQGVERMFVLWTRAETPQGVIINLDSPASDPVGRAGLSGQVDRHFWQKFGAALLFSLVDGAFQTGQAALAKSGTVTVNTGATSAAIAETLRGSANVQPTVRKNQGELVSIFVSRDLDFSSVYRVRPTMPRYAAQPGAGGYGRP